MLADMSQGIVIPGKLRLDALFSDTENALEYYFCVVLYIILFIEKTAYNVIYINTNTIH